MKGWSFDNRLTGRESYNMKFGRFELCLKIQNCFSSVFLLVTVLAGQKRYHFFSPQPKKELKTKQSRVGLDLDPAEALSVLLSTAYSLLFFNFYFSAWSWLFVLEYSIRSLLSFKRKAISALFFLFTIVDIRNLFVSEWNEVWHSK